jgi:hypothetical protein
MQGQFFLTARRNWLRFTAAVLLAAVLAGCGQLRELITPGAPAMSGEWAVLLDEIHAFERTIGFDATANFTDFVKDHPAYPICGHASRLVLPWSYEDPAIEWRDTESESECRARAPDDDIFFRRLEALGESETPVTSAMLAGKLDRFVYLVIHEDCHDQFALPYGIEEALCDFVTHKAMIAFAEQKYPAGTREQRSIRRYAETQASLVRATIDWYGRLEALYARYQRREIAPDALLRERAALFSIAEQPLGFGRGELNNVSLASNMTYSRHYPLMEFAFDASARDLARTVALFKKVDAAKPQAPMAQKQQYIADQRSVEFLRANENAIADAIREALNRGAGKPR